MTRPAIEMSVEELQEILRERIRCEKWRVRLEQEREEILERIDEIDRLLASLEYDEAEEEEERRRAAVAAIAALGTETVPSPGEVLTVREEAAAYGTVAAAAADTPSESAPPRVGVSPAPPPVAAEPVAPPEPSLPRPKPRKIPTLREIDAAESRIVAHLAVASGIPPTAVELANALEIEIEIVRDALKNLVSGRRIETEQGVYWIEGEQDVSAGRGTNGGREDDRSVRARILRFLTESRDLHKTAEVRAIVPDARPEYVSNVLSTLKKDHQVIRENGLWGVPLAPGPEDS